MPSSPKLHAWIETDLALPDGRRAGLAAGPPVATIAGTRADWPRLRDWLPPDDAPATPSRLPTRAAIGWFTYEGDFWFGRHEDIRILPADDWPAQHASWRTGPPATTLTRGQFAAGVRRIHEYIRSGDVYQVNLTRTVTAPFTGCPRALFTRLREVSPAPFATFLDTPERTVLSSSPELFLRIDGPAIETRPIKGTRPRFPDTASDLASATALAASPKERAELIMITDLERNDLGRVCEYGSVRVERLAHRESFAQVHHLSSAIHGRLRADIRPIDALAACFPGGSITGAPKIRAMDIIAELEPAPRGLYTGAIGFFGIDGISQFNIAIRTIEIARGEARYGTGSGITIDSDPDAEFDETLQKAAGIEAALRNASASPVTWNLGNPAGAA